MALPIPTDLFIDIVSFILQFIFGTLAFYVAGRTLSGVNAKFSDASIVVLMGLLLQLGIDTGIGYFLSLDPTFNEFVVFSWEIVGLLATFIVWMILVQYFFDCEFIRGLLIVGIGFAVILTIDLGIGIGLDYLIPILFP